MQMLIQLSVQLPRGKDNLFLTSNPQEPHPLHKKLCLIYVTFPEITQWQLPFDSYHSQEMEVPLQFKGH